ncbi:uncharacterized protein AC631_05100 [Debaryomyces fabryi]|uniref:Uncharacterized protein n=1 Tax=Debaryomyces fabryi TaxID=58627 RepID=A0A0V1PSJ9_9ASCO|nr:uncharacterized protein AC631_05100 [Debaryomyces fabryi]KRZ99138.1 hypothetical protein AC631_05100 [Debaryomyces fabryi]
MYRLVYETIARTLGHSVATSTEHYGTIANYPPSVNAADVLRSRHLGQVWHRLGLRRKFLNFEGEVVDPVPDPVDVDVDVDVDADVASDLSIGPGSPVSEDVEEVEPIRGDIGGNPVYADDEVDSISDMLMEIPRIYYNRAVGSADPTPAPSAAPPSPVPSRSPSPAPVPDPVPDPVSAPVSVEDVPAAPSHPPVRSSLAPISAPPVSVSWNNSTLSPNHATSSPYVHQLPGYRPPFSPPYHAPVPPYYAPASSEFALPPQDAYLGAPLYEAHVSREVLLEARKRHSREKRERKERKMEKKRKEKEKISKREENIRKREEKIRKREEKEKIRKSEKREKKERKREEEKREKERAALASPVTPVKTLKVKDVHLYLSATRGPLYRSESPSGPSGPSGSPRAMPSGPPTPNLSARRVYPLISQSSTQRLAIPGSSSHPSRVQKPPPSSRSLGSPPLFPETPRRSLLSPQHLRQRITESLQASPLGRFFAPGSPKSGSARKGPKSRRSLSKIKQDPVVISDLDDLGLEDLGLDYLGLDED